MPDIELLGAALLALVGWLWLDSIRARDAAIEAARSACEAEGLLLLDDTVSIASVRLARDGEGRIRLQRGYDFEYSGSGNDRIRGGIVLLGREVIMLNVGTRPDNANLLR